MTVRQDFVIFNMNFRKRVIAVCWWEGRIGPTQSTTGNLRMPIQTLKANYPVPLGRLLTHMILVTAFTYLVAPKRAVCAVLVVFTC